jgi:hypothetical protein
VCDVASMQPNSVCPPATSIQCLHATGHCFVVILQGAVAAAGDDEDDEEGMISVVPEDLRLEVLAARRGGASRSSKLVGPLAGVRLPDRPVVSGGCCEQQELQGEQCELGASLCVLGVVRAWFVGAEQMVV